MSTKNSSSLIKEYEQPEERPGILSNAALGRIGLPEVTTVLPITCMAALSEITGEREIIFPEIAAIAAGSLVAPKMPWRTNSLRIFISIALSALLGLLIVFESPGPVWLQMAIAYGISQILFLSSRTTFAPMISAIVLPVMLQSNSIIYFFSACLFTAAILGIRSGFTHMEILESKSYDPLPIPGRNEILSAVLRTFTAAILIFVFSGLRIRFAAAPPLLVAFTEFSRPSSPARKHPAFSVLLISGCAGIGALSRYILCMRLGLPLTLAAFASSVLFITVMHSFRSYIPPAGAIAILAMLIPEENVLLFPLQVLLGISVMMALDLALFRNRKN